MYKIEFEYFNKTGARVGSGVYYKTYRTESEAVRDAEKIYGNSKRFDWYIVDEKKKKGEKYYEFDERETGCVLRNDGQRTR